MQEIKRMDNLSEAVMNFTGVIMNNDLAVRAGSLITLFQAIGGLIIAYLVFNIISLWLGRRKAKEISRMREILDRMDKRLERIEKKKR